LCGRWVGYASVVSALIELVTAPARQQASLGETAHRPWPVPGTAWLQGQTWERLLFAHWQVDGEALRALVPAELELQTFAGAAWLGITPFRISGFRLRGTPPAPVLSSFLELNVRTYVEYGGRPGIWFFSLDAASRLAVELARRVYRLPYFHARMSARSRAGWIEYSSGRREHPAVWEGRYRAVGEPAPAAPGTVEHFLTERYCLYVVDAGAVHRAEIHHPPWALQEAEAEIELNTVAPASLGVAGAPALVHYSERQDVVIWPLERLY
jgi:uncharacterized protein YqjF (DUF2071 family)